MKKELIYQLVMAHYKNNENLFKKTTIDIANYFVKNDSETIGYNILAFIDGEAKMEYQELPKYDFDFLKKISPEMDNLYMPFNLKKNIEKIMKLLILDKADFTKFLFYGKPGTGKTKTVEFIAKKLNIPIYIVRSVDLVSSMLGETAKNIVKLIDEINVLKSVNKKSIILIDEIDLIALDRINLKDHREMGRATSSFFSLLDITFHNLYIFATTNLHANMDPALMRRFDWAVSFDKYNKDDLKEIFNKLVVSKLFEKDKISSKRLVEKIVTNSPYQSPAEIKKQLKIMYAISENEQEFFKDIFEMIHKIKPDLKNLAKMGLTSREASKILDESKSTIAKKMMENKHE